jgi:hypothetical protein
MQESHSKDIFTIPEYYKVSIDNIVTDENPRYHTTQVFYCTYKFYAASLVYCNRGNGVNGYEFMVTFSDLKFYLLGDLRIKPLPPMYQSTWDYNQSMLLFFKEYKSIDECATDVNQWLGYAKRFEETFLENVSGLNNTTCHNATFIANFIAAFTESDFEEHQFIFKKVLDESELGKANYKIFEFEKDNQLYFIALNNHKPYFALIKDFNISNTICEFYDVPIHPAYALQSIVFGMPTDILDWKLEEPYINSLTKNELQLIQNNKAATIGELMFNKWKPN